MESCTGVDRWEVEGCGVVLLLDILLCQDKIRSFQKVRLCCSVGGRQRWFLRVVEKKRKARYKIAV